MTAVDYAGIYFLNNDSNKILKLCDTLCITKPTVSFQESQIKSMVKALIDDLKDDQGTTKKLNFSHQYYIFQHSSVFFVFVGKQELPLAKLENFYMDLKSDLKKVCRNKLETLQDIELNDGFYQRQLQPQLE